MPRGEKGVRQLFGGQWYGLRNHSVKSSQTPFGQARMEFLLGQTRDADDFVARVGARENFELGLREVEQVGEEREAGGVGGSFHRRRRQPDLERLTDPAGDGIARGAG